MANDSGGGITVPDPNIAIADIIAKGGLQGQTTDYNEQMKLASLDAQLANTLYAHQQKVDQVRTQSNFDRVKLLADTVTKGRQVDYQHAVATAKAKAAAAGKPGPSPQELVDATLKGTETRTFRPQAPTSTMPSADTAGAGVLAAVNGGRAAQQAMRPGPSAQPQPQQQQLPSYTAGGQTYQAPPELVQRVASLGVRPVQQLGQVINMPTFSQQTVRSPNVLTAAQVAEANARQQQYILDKGLELSASSDAPANEAISAIDSYVRGGDMQPALELGRKYPQFSKDLAKLTIEGKRAEIRATNQQAAYYGAQAGWTNEQAAWWKLQREGADTAANWGDVLVGRRAAAGGMPGRKGAMGTTGSAQGGFAKLDPKEVYNEKTGDWDEAMLINYTDEQLESTGRIPYKDEGGSVVGGFGKSAGRLGMVNASDLANNFYLAYAPTATVAQRKAAIEALDSLPFIGVAYRNGKVEITPEGDSSYAATLAAQIASTTKNFVDAGMRPPEHLINPGLADALAKQKAEAAVAPTAAAPKSAGRQLTPYIVGQIAAHLPGEVARQMGKRAAQAGEYVGKAASAVSDFTAGLTGGARGTPEQLKQVNDLVGPYLESMGALPTGRQAVAQATQDILLSGRPYWVLSNDEKKARRAAFDGYLRAHGYGK